MDLLTSDGWLPSYRYNNLFLTVLLAMLTDTDSSISAVLMQIKLAISNLDPKPARLASNWNTSASHSHYSDACF
jgi:ubiquitin-conjugating enzyme E2 Q